MTSADEAVVMNSFRHPVVASWQSFEFACRLGQFQISIFLLSRCSVDHRRNDLTLTLVAIFSLFLSLHISNLLV